MAWTWYDSKIIKIEQASSTTRRVWLEIEGDIDFNFKPGQFVTMDLPIHEKRLKRWRSYSIANRPDGGKILEFCIVYLEDGAASKYLFETATVGTPIKFKGPTGTFTLPAEISKDLVFICTGTGIAPFRSMLLDIFATGKIHRKIHLIFGTRFEEGILYRRELEELRTMYPELKYSIALSREKVDGCEEGYVHQVYEEAYGAVRSDVAFYLCGWSMMVDEAVKNLTEKLGYPKEQVFYELYG